MKKVLYSEPQTSKDYYTTLKALELLYINSYGMIILVQSILEYGI